MIPARPMSGFLFVKKDELPGTIGKIHLPEQSSLRPVSGVVVRAADDISYTYTEGTRVLFGERAGELIALEGVPFLVLHSSEIRALIPAGVEVETP